MGEVAAIAEHRAGDAGSTDASLVCLAVTGDRTAQEALYRRHARLVFGLAHRLLAGRDDSEIDDVAQEAFLTAFERLATLRDPQSFAKWLGSITVRAAQRRLRRGRLRQRLGLRRPEPVNLERIVGSGTPPDVAAELRRIYGVVERLPVQVRTVLVLRRVEGLSIDEISEQMGLSPSTVKRRIRSADKVLQRHDPVRRGLR